MANFKQYQRGQRTLTTEQDFSKGMNYSNVPLGPGFWKTLINYDIDPTGSSIHPRAGFSVRRDIPLPSGNWFIHHSGAMSGTHEQYVDVELKYTLLFDPEQKRSLIIDQLDDTTYREVEHVDGLFFNIGVLENLYNLHGMIAPPTIEGRHPYAHLGNRTFFPSGDGILELSAEMIESGTLPKYTIKKVEPRQVTPSVATEIGYNLLLPDPYNYQSHSDIGLAFDITGVVVEDFDTGKAKLQALVNERVVFRAITEGPVPATGYYLWELTDLDNPDSPYKTTETQQPTLSVPVSVKRIRVTVAYISDGEEIATHAMGLYEFVTASDRSFEPIAYEVQAAKHITHWQQRLVAWGVPQGKNLLCVSQVGSANYFPYPHNADVFDGDIIACVPFLKDLLVFTTTQLHRVTLLPDGVGFQKEVIQDNLQLNEADITTVTTVQNMIFFKSNNYYYMIVPRTNTGEQGALQLAPISNHITNLLDDMYPFVRENLIRLYGNITQKAPELIKHTVFRDNAIIRCVYKFRVGYKYIDVFLNYSTVLRTWTTYTLESTDKNLFIRTLDVAGATNYATIDGESFKILERSGKVVTDSILEETTFDNLRLLDTGYRELNTQFKKRFREVQFKINNVNKKSLLFGTEFRLDEYVRKHLHNYNVIVENDYIKVVPEFKDISVSAGETVLEDTETLYIQDVDYTTEDSVVQLITNAWQLDVSAMADVSMKKVRVSVSGKGYAPRFILVSLNKEFYELTNFNWVYRTMNAR